MTGGEKRRAWSESDRIIIAIWQYETSVEMPDEERVTYTDANRRIHLKEGDNQTPSYAGYARKCEEYLRFGYEVDEATCGAYEPHDLLKICDTPQILLDAGFEQKPMLYTQRHLEQAIQSKSEEDYHLHGLTIPQVKRFPALLEKPVLLADSPSRKDVLLSVLNDVDSDKLPLIAAIKPDGKGTYELERIETNIILSVYGKDAFEKYFSERITPNMIVYFNKERGQELERLSGIQFPGCYSSLSLSIILRRPQCLVNSIIAGQDDPSVHSLAHAAQEARRSAEALSHSRNTYGDRSEGTPGRNGGEARD